jgi:hypothetical protein
MASIVIKVGGAMAPPTNDYLSPGFGSPSDQLMSSGFHSPII